MDWLEKFKPNKKKVVISLAIIILFYVLMNLWSASQHCKMVMNSDPECIRYASYMPYHTCSSGCYTFARAISAWLFILLPGIIYYVTVSILDMKSAK